ncbi:PAS domain S-box protein [Spirochaetota bacterium]
MAKKKFDIKDVSPEARKHLGDILEQTPNGILLVDNETKIHYVNPSFRTIFKCEKADIIGHLAKKYIHTDCFERAIKKDGKLMIKETVPKYNTSFRVGIFPIEGEDLFCGIFIDISDEELAHKQYRDLREQTLKRAQEVISKQMKTAQEIASLLGETTAETKVLLVKLMSLFKEEQKK